MLLKLFSGIHDKINDISENNWSDLCFSGMQIFAWVSAFTCHYKFIKAKSKVKVGNYFTKLETHFWIFHDPSCIEHV